MRTSLITWNLHLETSQGAEKLGNTMIHYSQEYANSPLGEALLQLGDVQVALAHLEKTFVCSLKIFQDFFTEILICLVFCLPFLI
jgi:hypothetical protein